MEQEKRILLDCRDAALGYEGKPVWEHLSFQVRSGDYVCIVGENGSGKSTLVKSLLGLLKPLSGEIVRSPSLRSGAIGYLPQQTAAQKDFPASVREVVLSGCLSRRGRRPFYSKTKKDIAKFRKIPYEAGKIEAIAYDSSGKETARTTLVSATGKTSIKLTPETTNLCANGQDLCFLNIDLIGENGITKSSVDQELKIEISGPATLQGYGSARPNVEESFCNDTFKTFYGKSLAVIRAGYEPGTVTVKVSGKGLDTQELTLNIC